MVDLVFSAGNNCMKRAYQQQRSLKKDEKTKNKKGLAVWFFLIIRNTVIIKECVCYFLPHQTIAKVRMDDKVLISFSRRKEGLG